MLTISKLAKRLNISRTTVLYYEKEGLLSPKYRAENGYRWYGEKEITRMEQIMAYRTNGLPVSVIRQLLDNLGNGSQFSLLRSHFDSLTAEINQLRAQQKAMITMMQEPDVLMNNGVTKEGWVEIMKASGFSEDGMIDWHRQYEKMSPKKHLQFLRTLKINENEIDKIRNF